VEMRYNFTLFDCLFNCALSWNSAKSALVEANTLTTVQEDEQFLLLIHPPSDPNNKMLPNKTCKIQVPELSNEPFEAKSIFTIEVNDKGDYS
jgi:hypothetical protein